MIYLDNAATTPLDKRVFEEMTPFFLEYFGNPSSTHSLGRSAKVAIETARKSIAKRLNCLSSELFFVSCATEANNAIIKGVVDKFDIQHIITSKLEHHAVLHPIEALEKQGLIQCHYIENNQKGTLNLNHLEQLLKNNPKAFVSIMHGNNEIGNINPINEIGLLCKKHNALFHSDTVQTIGHFNLDLSTLPVDYLVASAHKFHGPKGIGFLYARKDKRFSPLLLGGAQEKDFRAGTENIAGIMGMAKAFDLAFENPTQEADFKLLKTYLIDEIQDRFDFIKINGADEQTLNNIISLSIAPKKTTPMLLFSLDLQGISVSGGSACGSGAIKSHVTDALGISPATGILRISLSKFNTKEELNTLLNKLEAIFS